MTESEALDERVVQALDYYRRLIEAGRHAPGSEARTALAALNRALREIDGEKRGASWH